MDLNINGYALLSNLNKINIVLGKNGCGKSTALRRIDTNLESQPQYGKSKYISPERGGIVIYNSSAEHNVNTVDRHLQRSRRKNLANDFRQQSVAQYRNLELLTARDNEFGTSDVKFGSYVDRINSLLDNITIKRRQDWTTFKIFKKGTSSELSAETISSGESELISLGIEILVFSKELEDGKENFLLLDEPDVHLHPDLQVRLMKFLIDLIEDSDNFRVLIATHSTAILSALESYDGAHLAFMTYGQTELKFNPISEIHKKILPVLGAHPLSNVFNEESVLFLEGGDDERIWQQVVRSSGGKVRIHPRSVEGVTKLDEFEKEAQKIIETVYDNAKGYSLRDRDETTGEISDLVHVKRMKLSCRASENLLLSDEVLEKLGCSWGCLKAKVNSWLKINHDHGHYAIMRNFKDEGYDRKNFDLKKIRNDLMGIIGSEKPWEVAVGQTIATMTWNDNTDFNEDGKLLSFLGEKVVKTLLPKD